METRGAKQVGICKFCIGLCHRGITGEFGPGGVGWCITEKVWLGGGDLSMSLTNLKFPAPQETISINNPRLNQPN